MEENASASGYMRLDLWFGMNIDCTSSCSGRALRRSDKTLWRTCIWSAGTGWRQRWALAAFKQGSPKHDVCFQSLFWLCHLSESQQVELSCGSVKTSSFIWLSCTSTINKVLHFYIFSRQVASSVQIWGRDISDVWWVPMNRTRIWLATADSTTLHSRASSSL